MSSVALKTLSILLGLFFIFIGVMKLTPVISKEMHLELKREFAKYTKSIPKLFTYKIPSKWYRRVVGGVEVACGIALTFLPFGKVKRCANVVLIVLMIGAALTHYIYDNKVDKCAPAVVMIFMLTCRLIVEYQVNNREKSQAAAAAAFNAQKSKDD